MGARSLSEKENFLVKRELLATGKYNFKDLLVVTSLDSRNCRTSSRINQTLC